MTTTNAEPRNEGRGARSLVADPPDAMSFSDALSELIRVVQFRDRDRACCHELSVSQCYALKGLVDGEGLTVNELAAHLYLDKSTASRVANGLVAKKLVRRVRDEDDGRVVRLVPTDSGRSVLGRIEADLAEEYSEMLSDFEPEVRTAMERLLRRLAGSFSARVQTQGGSCCVVR